MINLPYDDIIKVIEEKSPLSREEIENKVNDKLSQLSGLISKEGAAHIIANDLGINFSDMEKKLEISKIMAGMRNVSLTARIVQKYELREFNKDGRQGRVANLLIGDESGVTRLVMWNDQTKDFERLKENDVLRITNANARSGQNGRVELHLNDQSKLEINPEGEEVAKPPVRETPRKKISELNEQDTNAEILGTVVQVFDPRFFEVDPDTGRRIRPSSDGKFYNAQGNEVTPDFSYVFNVFVDDGTSSIRVVCFRNQMQAMTSKDHSNILSYKDDPSSFEPVKHDLLGKMMKLQGRVVKNDMFDRTEFIASRVYPDPDPKEEMKDDQKGKEGGRSIEAPSSPETTESTHSQDNISESSEKPHTGSEEPEIGKDVPESDVKFSDASEINDESSGESSDDLGDIEGSTETPAEDTQKKEDPDDLENLEELEDMDDDI